MRVGCSTMLGCVLLGWAPAVGACCVGARLWGGPKGLAAALAAGAIAAGAAAAGGVVVVIAAKRSLKAAALAFIVTVWMRVLVGVLAAVGAAAWLGLPVRLVLLCLIGSYLGALCGECVWLVKALRDEYGLRLLRRSLFGPKPAAMIDD
ncbi:MAG TPA: hypothetical protein VNA25_28770 [Phycisphaerae bacterium]|nr:hypothetical protein [Phycisphaerae bacterium]HUT61850.1 hypothetical protein [Phycisphaerae bacterium]